MIKKCYVIYARYIVTKIICPTGSVHHKFYAAVQKDLKELNACFSTWESQLVTGRSCHLST